MRLWCSQRDFVSLFCNICFARFAAAQINKTSPVVKNISTRDIFRLQPSRVQVSNANMGTIIKPSYKEGFIMVNRTIKATLLIITTLETAYS